MPTACRSRVLVGKRDAAIIDVRCRETGANFVSDVSILAKLSEALRGRWSDPQRKVSDGRRPFRTESEQLFLRALSMVRGGDSERALGLYGEAIALTPDFVEAIEARAELLDMLGDKEQAGVGFAEARRLKATMRQGPPDRPFAVRARGNFLMEVGSYDIVLHSLRKNALPYLARGNAYLASGHPDAALSDYDKALQVKPGLLDAITLRAEALQRLARYDEALAAVDLVLATRSADAEALSTRAVILMALGRLDAANADLNRQLALLPTGQAAARGCVALRLASYEVAAAEFDSALLRHPDDAYWHLYRSVAEIRLGQPARGERLQIKDQAWPQLLLAFHAGQASEQAVMAQADSDDRRAESWFQFGVRAVGQDREAARQHWQQVVDHGAPSLIEHAAARNELARG